MKQLYDIIFQNDYFEKKEIICIKYFLIIDRYHKFLSLNKTWDNLFIFRKRMIKISIGTYAHLNSLRSHFIRYDDIENYKKLLSWVMVHERIYTPPNIELKEIMYHYSAYRIYKYCESLCKNVKEFQLLCKYANLKMIKYEMCNNRNVDVEWLSYGMSSTTSRHQLYGKPNRQYIVKYLVKQLNNKIENL